MRQTSVLILLIRVIMAEVVRRILTSLMHHIKGRKDCVEPFTTTVPQHLYQSKTKCPETYLP